MNAFGASTPLLVERIAEAAVEARTAVADRHGLIVALSRLVAAAAPGIDASAIEQQLRERESAACTALGQGLAIPHATVAGVSQTLVAVMTLEAPVSFADGEAVDVCFCLVGPPDDRDSHLRLLAAIAEAVMTTPLLEQLRAAETTTQLLAALGMTASSAGPLALS